MIFRHAKAAVNSRLAKLKREIGERLDLRARVDRLESELREQRATLEAAIRALRGRDFVLERFLTASSAARPPGASRAVAALGVPAASIVLPTYNRAAYVGEAIDSVRAQVFADWELIVVDDGSEDDTAAVVARYRADPRIRYLRQPRGGCGAARNRGLAETRAPLVAYIDSDNLWYPEYLACAVDYLATHPEVDLVYGALVTELHGLETSHLFWRPFDRAALVAGNFIDTNVIVHRRALLAKYGDWDPRLHRLGDWDLALRFTADKPAQPLAVLATRYRSCDAIRVSEVDPMDPEMAIMREKLKLDVGRAGAERPRR